MRYSENCENFARKSKTVDPSDLIYLKAEELIEVETKLVEIRANRYRFVAFNANLEPKVIDKVGFDKTIADEAEVMDSISKTIQLFNLLNPLFDKILKELPRLTEPNITGLKKLKTNLRSLNLEYMNRCKAEASKRLQSRNFNAGNMPLNEIVNSDSFKAFCAPLEEQTAKHEADIIKIDNYINEIKKIFADIYNEEMI